MSYVTKIIATFGGRPALAKAIAFPVSTVKSWEDRGSIPDKHKPGVLSAAQLHNLPLTKADFFPVSPPEFSTPER